MVNADYVSQSWHCGDCSKLYYEHDDAEKCCKKIKRMKFYGYALIWIILFPIIIPLLFIGPWVLQHYFIFYFTSNEAITSFVEVYGWLIDKLF